MDENNPCNCENALCLEEHMDKEEGCKEPGGLECMFIGLICKPCSAYMPQEYLDIPQEYLDDGEWRPIQDDDIETILNKLERYYERLDLLYEEDLDDGDL